MADLKAALCWAASCGGCGIAPLAIGERTLKLAEAADITLWPVAMDVEHSDVERMPDKSIDACLFNGAVRTSEVDEAICHGCERCQEIYTFHAPSELGWSSPNVSDYF